MSVPMRSYIFLKVGTRTVVHADEAETRRTCGSGGSNAIRLHRSPSQKTPLNHINPYRYPCEFRLDKHGSGEKLSIVKGAPDFSAVELRTTCFLPLLAFVRELYRARRGR